MTDDLDRQIAAALPNEPDDKINHAYWQACEIKENPLPRVLAAHNQRLAPVVQRAFAMIPDDWWHWTDLELGILSSKQQRAEEWRRRILEQLPAALKAAQEASDGR